MRSAVDVTGSGSTPGIDEENQMHGSGWKTFPQNREAWVRTLHRANGTDKSATHNGWYGLRKETDSFRIADDPLRVGSLRQSHRPSEHVSDHRADANDARTRVGEINFQIAAIPRS